MKSFLKLLYIGAGCIFVAFIAVWWIFFGGVVKSDAVIYLSSTTIEQRGYERVRDSLILPHLKHSRAFNLYAERLNLSQRIRPGRYELKRGENVIDVVRQFKLGLQSSVDLTFNNIRLRENLAGCISHQIEADSISILEALRSDELARSVGLKSSEEIISLFIPNTYKIWWSITPEDLVRRMKRESDNFWSLNRRAERLKSLNMSRVDVITLASIVNEECSLVAEMPRVAGVYINRLNKRMRLQADPTVKYAVGDFSLKRILNKHLECDSPYNTYLYRGLPPSPITIPSIAAIDAVLNYEHHNYIYFCARTQMDGGHNFTSSYSEHLKNAEQYSKELNRRGIR